ncbi:MAG TPA: hypothetical protein VGL92_05205 [Acidimicrobiia bacterium]
MKMAVECPGCGRDAEVELGRRSAELFCDRCDYPLFWVSVPRTLEDDDIGGDMTLRRRPGAAGIRLQATVGCPACREPNPLTGMTCLRCGSALYPEPEPEPVPPEPEPLPAPEPEPEPPRWPAWLPAVVAIAVVVLVALLIWLLS